MAMSSFPVAAEYQAPGSSPGEELRVLRAGRSILQDDPRVRVALALNEAAGRGRSQYMLLALNRLDSIAIETYKTSVFELEENPLGPGQLLGIFDKAISRVERQL